MVWLSGGSGLTRGFGTAAFGGVSCHCCGAAAGNRHFCDYSNRSYIAVLFFEFLALEKIPLFHPRDRDT
jgi:hypothetical protein